MKLTKTGIGLLTRQYRSVLHKCFLINAGVFGLMAKTLRGTLNAAAFNVADGLLASAVMATIATTLALSSPANADELDRQVVEAGQKVESIIGTYKNHLDILDTSGWVVYNGGIIGTIDATISNNQHTNTNKDYPAAIVNKGGTINHISGNYIDNYVETSKTGSGDDGAIISSINGKIGEISGVYKNNKLKSTAPTSDSNVAGGVIFLQQGEVYKISGIYENNGTESAKQASGNHPTGSGVISSYLSPSIHEVDAVFIGNYSIDTEKSDVQGGVGGFGNVDVIKGQFLRNYVSAVSGEARAGALVATDNVDSLKDSIFVGNYAQSTSGAARGGAIYNTGTIDSLKDSNFVGNYVQSTSNTAQGGAIYNRNKIGIDAVNSNVYFYNNRAIQGENTRYNDIYNIGTLELNANANNSIIFNGSIEGSSGKININTDNLSGGTYVFNNAISGNSVTIGSSTATAPVNIKLGTVQQADGSTSYGLLSGIALTNNGLNTLLDLRNENIDTHSLTTLTLNNQMNLAIDAQLSGASGSADRINVSGSKTAAANSLIVSAINLDNTTYNGSSDKVTIQLTTDSTLKNAYTLSSDIMNNISGNNYYTSVTYDKTTGSLIFDDKLINHSTLNSILANNYYTNYEFSMAKSFIKAANDNNFTTLNCVKEA